MDQCGAGCDLAFDITHLLPEYRWAGHSIHRKWDGGDTEHQRENFDDHGDGSERQRELQPGAGATAGNDPRIEDSADCHGKIYGCGKSGVPEFVWNGMFV